MGSVECVTDHVPWSHSRAGAVKEVDDGDSELYLDAVRSVIAGLDGPEEMYDAGTSTTIVVPPGDSPGSELAI